MNPGGIRLGTSELTRLGMKESEMVEVAELMKRIVVDGEDPVKVGAEAAELCSGYERSNTASITPLRLMNTSRSGKWA